MPLKLCLKKLQNTSVGAASWGIHFHRPAALSTLPPCPSDFRPAPLPDPLPGTPDIDTLDTLTCFLDAAHANNLRHRRSTTGFAFLLAGGCISYKGKTQTTTATSSTEAEFYAAVSAAKHALYLRSILTQLGVPLSAPTPLYCDNQSAIKMINARIPTERSRHIAIQHFAIQNWKDDGHVVMRFIPGVLN